MLDVRDIITCFQNFGDDRYRGLASAESQILPFPIDFDGRPYNNLTVLCERVIMCINQSIALRYSSVFKKTPTIVVAVQVLLLERNPMMVLADIRCNRKLFVACTIFFSIFMYSWLSLTELFSAVVDKQAQHINEEAELLATESMSVSFPRVIIPTSVNHNVSFDCKTAYLMRMKFPICIYAIETDEVVSRHMNHKSYFEAQLIRVFLNLLFADKRLHLVDIGANIGAWSLPAARIAKVISVEPNWNSMSRLAKAVDLGAVSSNITLIHNAISNVRTTLRMGVFKTNQGHAFLIHTDKCNITPTGLPCLTLPPTKTIFLNDLLPLMRSRRALIKVDTEGHEVNVFTNATAGEFFDRIDVPVVFLEWLLCKIQPADIVRRLLNFFYSRNYSPFNMRNSKLTRHYFRWPSNIFFKKMPRVQV